MNDFIMFCAGFVFGMSTILMLNNDTFLTSIFFFLGALLFFLNTTIQGDEELLSDDQFKLSAEFARAKTLLGGLKYDPQVGDEEP